MQDNRDGQLHEIPAHIMEQFKPQNEEKLKEAFQDLKATESKIRKAMEPIIPRDKQGGIWFVGKEVIIEGGKFRCCGFNKSLIQLEPIAS